MSQMSNYLQEKLLKLVLRSTAFTAPDVWVALYTTAPTDAGGGVEVSTSGGTLYVRQNVVGTGAWSAPAGEGGGGMLSDNLASIPFPVAGADWGTIKAFGLKDSDIGGSDNLLVWGLLTVDKVVNNGDQFTFPLGELNIIFR
jgi:hypothetical protein